jgi:hypothetical protein
LELVEEKNLEITFGATCEHKMVGPHLNVTLAIGCSHNPTSQKGCWTTKKNNQNWINIYVFSFKTMAFMASYYFLFMWMSKEFKTKNPFDEILSLTFDLKPLKLNNNVSDKGQFCKGFL